MKCLLPMVCLLILSSIVSAEDWPQWRGVNRDGISLEKGLLKTWPNKLPLRWKVVEIGVGYASPAIVKGSVFLQTTRGDKEIAIAFDEKTGQERWSTEIGTVGVNRGPQYPGTRSTPTVDGDHVYCLASAGQLVCVKVANGQAVWSKHLQKDFDGVVGNWAYSESPLVDGGLVICTPGGKEAALAAFKKGTGELVWKTAIPGGDRAEYASIVRASDGKRSQYVQFLGKGIVGVDAKSGALLWKYAKTASVANIATPIVSGSRVFTSGSRSGGALVQLKPAANGTEAIEVYHRPGLGASIGGAVLVGDKLFGTTRQAAFCADFVSGRTKWAKRAGGAASISYADGRLYMRFHKSGDVALVEANADSYREVGRMQQDDRSGTAAWPHPVIANGGLYLRDQGTLLCYDIADRERASK